MNFWAQYISRPVAIYCRNFSFGSFKQSHRAEKEKSLKFVLSRTYICAANYVPDERAGISALAGCII